METSFNIHEDIVEGEAASTRPEVAAIDWAASRDCLLTVAGPGEEVDTLHGVLVERLMQIKNEPRGAAETRIGYTPAGWWWRGCDRQTVEVPEDYKAEIRDVWRTLNAAIVAKNFQSSVHPTADHSRLGGLVGKGKTDGAAAVDAKLVKVCGPLRATPPDMRHTDTC